MEENRVVICYPVFLFPRGSLIEQDIRRFWKGKNSVVMEKEIQEQNIEEILESGRAVQIKPQGYSMYPVIVPGRDEAIVQKADPAKMKRGDVALYRRDRSILVIHRIWRKDEKGFYMVGDNQTEIEGPLRPDQIKGKMVVLIRNGKEIDVKSLRYRIPCSIWLCMRPVRRPVSLVAAAVKRLLKRQPMNRNR